LSYQRLEFLGDAVLDVLIILYLAEHARNLPHGRMHLIKAAMVNAEFLAYLCLHSFVEQEVVNVSPTRDSGSYIFEEQRSVRFPNLSHFMQYRNPDIDGVLRKCESRYERARSDIKNCLEHGYYYPWDLFSTLAPEKFLSDIVESMFGRSFAGDLRACERFAESLGLLEYLRRVVAEDIDLQHPKNILGEVAGKHTVQYAVDLRGKGYSCAVEIGGIEITRVVDASSRDEAITRAASQQLDY
jgi:dsRNA-specific ribonuclease